MHLLELLNSPVPIIVGLNVTIKEFKSNIEKNIDGHDDLIVVDLDNYEMHFDSINYNEFIEPHLGGVFRLIEQEYVSRFNVYRINKNDL
jgi:hypothetical protein